MHTSAAFDAEIIRQHQFSLIVDIQRPGGTHICAGKAAFDAFFTVQFNTAFPALCYFESAVAGNLALAAANAILVLDRHGVLFGVIADDVCRAVIDDEVFERKVKGVFIKGEVTSNFRKSLISQDRVFMFAIDLNVNGMNGTYFNTNAAHHTQVRVHIHRGRCDHSSVNNFTIQVG